jgi:CheY-like chemotaxis protein
MLRDLVISETRPLQGASIGSANAASQAGHPRPRLLIVHHGDGRLAALEAVLIDLGYDATLAATGDDALAAISRGPLPDVLLTGGQPNTPRRGVAFARDCLAKWPALRAMYVTFVPRLLPDARAAREHVLIAPFNADQLATALSELWPGKAIAR